MIEVDGNGHRSELDKRREDELLEAGLVTYRFADLEVQQGCVLAKIIPALARMAA